MSYKSAIHNFFTAGFNIDNDLMLYRKLILVTTLQAMILLVSVFFAIYNFVVINNYLVASLDTISLVITLYAVYLLHVKKQLDVAIYIVVAFLFFFMNAFAASNQNEGYGLIWNFFYPIFVILLLGPKRSILTIIAFYAVLLTQAYLGIDVWQNGDWDITSFIRFTFASFVIVYISYFNEWSIDRSYTELQRVRTREKEASEEYTQSMLKMLDNKKQLLVDVSHELRTPLSVLKVYIEALEDGITNQEESYPVLQRKLNQIDRLIQDIYLLSKSDINQLKIEPELIIANELFEELYTSFNPLAQDNNLSITLHNHCDEHANFEGDWERLLQVYGNLLQNSINYTDPNGEIRLSVSMRDQGIEVIVEDSAPGVAKEEQEKLFERLYRIDSSRNRATGGSGLGLAICEAIIEAHHGKISVSDSTLGGLKTTTWLPLTYQLKEEV